MDDSQKFSLGLLLGIIPMFAYYYIGIYLINVLAKDLKNIDTYGLVLLLCIPYVLAAGLYYMKLPTLAKGFMLGNLLPTVILLFQALPS